MDGLRRRQTRPLLQKISSPFHYDQRRREKSESGQAVAADDERAGGGGEGVTHTRKPWEKASGFQALRHKGKPGCVSATNIMCSRDLIQKKES